MGIGDNDFAFDSGGWTSEDENGWVPVERRGVARSEYANRRHKWKAWTGWRQHGNGVIVIDLKNSKEVKAELDWYRDHPQNISSIELKNATKTTMTNILRDLMTAMSKIERGQVVLSTIKFTSCDSSIASLNSREVKAMKGKMEKLLERIAEKKKKKQRDAKIKGDKVFKAKFGDKVRLVQPVVVTSKHHILRLNGGTSEVEDDEEDRHGHFLIRDEDRKFRRKPYQFFLCTGGTTQNS